MYNTFSCISKNQTILFVGYCILFARIIANFFVEAIVSFLEWYEVSCHQREFNEEKLIFMENFMRRYA